MCLCGLYCVCADENEGGPYPPYIAWGVGLQIGYFHFDLFTRYEVTDHMISIISEQILLIPDNLYIAL